MKKIFFTALLASAFLFSNAQTSVVPYTSDDVTPEGMIYYLPKRELVFKVTAECKEYKAGPFYRYAERFFADKNVIVEDSKEWSLVSVKLSYRAQPNENLAFEVKPDLKGGVSNFISYSNSAPLIKGINIEPDKVRTKSTYKRKNFSVEEDSEFDMSVLIEETLVANSIPKMAELAAKQVYRLRESRAALLNGDVDIMPSGEAMKEVLKEIDEQEEKLLELFYGKTITHREKKEYTYCPEDDVTKNVIFRISSIEGLLDADNIMGSAVYVDVVGTYPLAPQPPKKPAKILGFAYNVPGRAHVKVYDNNKEYDEIKEVVMPQFGYVQHLPAALTDNPNVSIKYYMYTGTILSIEKK